MDRRDFVKAAVATGSVMALAGCTPAPSHARAHVSGSPSTGPSGSPSGTPTGSPTGTGTAGPHRAGRTSWRAFGDGLDGELLRPSQNGFSAASQLYNPRFDRFMPSAVVRPASAEDVAETIRFARAHGLAVRARSGGHSYVGASTGNGVIQLDLRGLSALSYDAGSATLEVGPGAALFDVHTKLDPVGRSVPTGTCPTVGAAGLILGGGVGVESRAYGLSCDALRALTVVTADGTVRQVDADHDADLLWASKGGGGGSFGVVTSLTMDTVPAHAMDFFFLGFADSDATAVVRGWQRRVAAMPRSAWANLHIDASGSGLGVRIVGVSLAGDAAHQAQAMEAAVGRSASVTTFSRSHHDGVRLLAGCSTLSDQDCRLAPAGKLDREAFVAGSDVVGRRMSTAEADRLVTYLRQRAASGQAGTVILDPLGGRVADPAPGDTAFRWRRAVGIAQWYVGMPSTASRAAVGAAYDWVRGGHAAFGSVTAGGYVNYLEPRRRLGAYYGRNLARLRQVKAAYDPDDFFHTGYSVRLP